jgi:hypothetical protein
MRTYSETELSVGCAMLANIVIALSGVAGGFTLLDFLLGDRVQKSLSTAVTRAWFWFDDVQRYLTRELLSHSLSLSDKKIIILTALAGSVVVFGTSYLFRGYTIPGPLGDFESSKLHELIFLVLGMIVILLGWFLRGADTIRDLLTKIGLLWLISAAVVVAAVTIGALMYYDKAPPGLVDAVLVLSLFLWPVIAFAIVGIGTITALVTVYLCLLVLIYTLMVVLRTMEVLLRRIAEHNKGPIIAISVLVGSLATLFKVFS